MRYESVSDPVYAPNSKGGPDADAGRYGEPAGWSAGGEIVRSEYVSHAEDDDWGQAGTLVRDVLDDDARARLVANIVGHLLDAVTEPVLQRASEYWRNVDKNLGDKETAAMTNIDYLSTNEDRPQVKLLDDALFLQLGSGGEGYAAALLAEYGRADQVIEQQNFDWGVLATITFPANVLRPARTTHLVFGGCWEPQAREYLVSVGLGGLPITTVYAPDTVVMTGAPADDSDEL